MPENIRPVAALMVQHQGHRIPEELVTVLNLSQLRAEDLEPIVRQGNNRPEPPHVLIPRVIVNLVLIAGLPIMSRRALVHAPKELP